jgi:hypothetical protein
LINQSTSRTYWNKPIAGEGSDEEALACFAKMLSDERKLQSNLGSY